MNQHKFAFRVGVLVLLIAVMAGVFSVRLHNVQITQAAEQDPTPSGSVTYHTRVTAARGEILDRNGNVLVGNRASYNLVIVREVLMSADAPNENLRRLVDLCSELGLEYTDHFPVTQEKPYAYVDSGSSLWDGYFRTFLTERGWDTDVSAPQLIRWLKEIYHLPADWTEEECRRVISLRYELDLRRYIGTLDTYVLMTDVDALSLAAITELNIPGLNVETSSVRQYNTTLAAHILGTIGKMDGTDWETYESKGYAMDAYIGKDGLEQAFEEELHGSDGTRVTTITADGNILEEHYAVDPVAGNNIETTIDLGLQKVAEESLAAKILSLRENGVGVSGNGKDAEGGAVVVMKVKTGEVLACASYPTYDLSTYNTNYNELAADPYKPFNNRALGLPYPPGSTYKMVTTIAAIDSGTISRWTEIEDEGVYTRFEDAGYMPRCMLYTTTGATHGLINVMKALAVSCNYYFYEAGYRTGITAIDNTAKALGLPEATGALIGSVMPDEPAAKGGMKDGDVVLEVNGQKIDDSSALLRAIATEAPGSKVNMVVWRDGERKNITVQLGERNLKASSGKSGSAVEQDAPSIGLSVRPLTKEEARTANVKPGTGLLIVGVEPGKLAAEAELREGDIILSANLKPIKSVEEFSKIIREDAKKRGVVMLQLQRQGQTFFRSLALSDTPDGAKK